MRASAQSYLRPREAAALWLQQQGYSTALATGDDRETPPTLTVGEIFEVHRVNQLIEVMMESEC